MPRKSKSSETKKEKQEKSEKKVAKKTVEKPVEKPEESEKKTKKTTKTVEKTLIPLEDYIKASVHLGTKVITPHLRPYVYRRRADGIAVLNTNLIDKKLKEAIEFLKDFKPEDIIVVCKREAGWHAVNLFSKLTGIRAFTKKYPAGIITNLTLPDFFEVDLIMICDPWMDKNALNDANNIGKKVLALCDTNNLAFGVDQIIPCNNKNNRALGLIFYILTQGYLKAKKIKKKMPKLSEFMGEEPVVEEKVR